MPSRSSLQIEVDYFCDEVRLLERTALFDRRKAASLLVSARTCLHRASSANHEANEQRLRAAVDALERMVKERT